MSLTIENEQVPLKVDSHGAAKTLPVPFRSFRSFRFLRWGGWGKVPPRLPPLGDVQCC
jgi:hypothetical protein